jgi:hypothetical protein
MWLSLMPPVSRKLDLDNTFGCLFWGRLICMFRACSQLNWAIIVVIAVHWEITDALAVVAALPIVSSDVTKVFVHFELNIPQEVTASCWIGRTR